MEGWEAMDDFTIKWSDSVKFMVGENKTLVSNIDCGQSMFVSNECIEILNNAEKEKMTAMELIECVEDLASQKYIQNLIIQLNKHGMWDYMGTSKVLARDLDISFDITNKCNLRCKHCSVCAGDNIRGNDMTVEQLKKMLKSIAKLRPKIITFSGGEPLVHPAFRELTELVRKYHQGGFSLMTNAILIDEKMARFIKKHYNSVDVSIDGVDEDSCSKIRGKGVFEKTIKGIKNLVKQKCRVAASMVITNENVHLKQQFAELCDYLGVEYIFRSFDPIGRGMEHKQEFRVREQDELIETACWENCEKKFIERKDYKKPLTVFSCQGAKRQFQIDHRGNIYPCGAMMGDEFIMGNACKIEDLGQYLINGKFKCTQGYKNFQKYMPYNVPKCKGCNKQMLCFTCANEIKSHVDNNSFEIICENNDKYYDLYWRYYGTC